MPSTCKYGVLFGESQCPFDDGELFLVQPDLLVFLRVAHQQLAVLGAQKLDLRHQVLSLVRPQVV